MNSPAITAPSASAERDLSEWVIDRIYGRGNPPSDFGVYVTAENIDVHLREVRAQIMALPHQKDSWAELMEEE